MLILAGLATAYRFFFMTAPPLEAETVPIRVSRSSTAGALLAANGYVVAQRQASVASKGTGRVEYIGVSVGSRVHKGAVIARLQQDDVRAAQRQAFAQLDVAKAAFANADTDLRDATLHHKRTQTLLDQHYVSQAEYDTASARLHRAEAAVRSAAAAIKASEADVQSATVMLDNTVIRAPFDGTVLKKFAEVGEVVAPMASSANSRGAVVLIADPASLAVEAELSETSIGKVQPGQPAEITLDGVPGTRYPASVEQIVPTADRTKGTVLVKVRFLRLGPEVLPDMSAKVSFQSETSASPATDRFVVPTSALVTRGETLVIQIRDDQDIHELPVTVWSRRGGECEVLGPLREGMAVIRFPRISP